jgi:hypothetical protein
MKNSDDMKRLSSGSAEPANPVPERFTFAMLPVENLRLPAELHHQAAGGEAMQGLFFTPLVVWQSDDGAVIIDGCKRYEAALAKEQAKIACAVIDAPFDPVRAGLLRIGLNGRRPMQLREKYLFLRWLHAHLDKEMYLAESGTLSVSPQERHEIEQLFDCPDELVASVLDGRLDITVAPEIVHLTKEDTKALVTLFGTVAFSRQMQRELAEWLHEIAFMEKTPMATFIAADPFAGILADPKLNAPQRAARLHDLVHERRFPLFAKAKALWVDHSRKVNPDPRAVSFQSSPFFERKNCEIRIRLNDAAAAKNLMKKLAGIGEEEWKGLIDATSLLK